MARTGRFGSLPGQAPDISATVASLMEAYENARDRNIYSAWAEGGEFEGGKVTDKRLMQHFKDRREEYEKGTPDWDYWNEQTVQLDWKIDESKATLKYAQGGLTDMGMSQWYVTNAKRFTKNSEAWRNAMRSAAQYKRYAAEKRTVASTKSDYEIYQGRMGNIQKHQIDPARRVERLLLDLLVVQGLADQNIQSINELSASEIADMDEALSALGTDEELYGGQSFGNKPEVVQRWNSLNDAWKRQYGRDFRVEDYGLLARKMQRGYDAQVAVARKYGYESDVPSIKAAARDARQKAVIMRAAHNDVYDELNDIYDELDQMAGSGGAGLTFEDVQALAKRASALATLAGSDEVGDFGLAGEANSISMALMTGRAVGNGTDIGQVDPSTGLTVIPVGENGWVNVQGLPSSAKAAGIFQGVVRQGSQYATGEKVLVVLPDGSEVAMSAAQVAGNPDYAVYPSSATTSPQQAVAYGDGQQIVIGDPVRYQKRRDVYAVVVDKFGNPIPDPSGNPIARIVPGVTFIMSEDGKPLYTIEYDDGTAIETPYLHTESGYEVGVVNGELAIKVPNKTDTGEVNLDAEAMMSGEGPWGAAGAGQPNSGFITNTSTGLAGGDQQGTIQPTNYTNGTPGRKPLVLDYNAMGSTGGAIYRGDGDANSALAQMMLTNPDEFVKQIEQAGPAGLAQWIMDNSGGDFQTAMRNVASVSSYANLSYALGGPPVPGWLIEQAGDMNPVVYLKRRMDVATAHALYGDDPESAATASIITADERAMYVALAKYEVGARAVRDTVTDETMAHAAAELIRAQAEPGETPEGTVNRLGPLIGTGSPGAYNDYLEFAQLGIERIKYEQGLSELTGRTILSDSATNRQQKTTPASLASAVESAGAAAGIGGSNGTRRDPRVGVGPIDTLDPQSARREQIVAARRASVAGNVASWQLGLPKYDPRPVESIITPEQAAERARPAFFTGPMPGEQRGGYVAPDANAEGVYPPQPPLYIPKHLPGYSPPAIGGTYEPPNIVPNRNPSPDNVVRSYRVAYKDLVAQGVFQPGGPNVNAQGGEGQRHFFVGAGRAGFVPPSSRPAQITGLPYPAIPVTSQQYQNAKIGLASDMANGKYPEGGPGAGRSMASPDYSIQRNFTPSAPVAPIAPSNTYAQQTWGLSTAQLPIFSGQGMPIAAAPSPLQSAIRDFNAKDSVVPSMSRMYGFAPSTAPSTYGLGRNRRNIR